MDISVVVDDNVAKSTESGTGSEYAVVVAQIQMAGGILSKQYNKHACNPEYLICIFKIEREKPADGGGVLTY